MGTRAIPATARPANPPAQPTHGLCARSVVPGLIRRACLSTGGDTGCTTPLRAAVYHRVTEAYE